MFRGKRSERAHGRSTRGLGYHKKVQQPPPQWRPVTRNRALSVDLFGASLGVLAFCAAGTLIAVLAALVLLAWRRPLLVKLGLRAVPRRWLRTGLIIAGLTTSTAVIATAIGTGETMGATIRAVVAGGIGPVDEVIVYPGTSAREPGLRDPRAVLAGGDLAAGAYFPISRYEELSRYAASEPSIAALAPAVQAQATAVNLIEGRSRAGVNLLGLPPGAPVFDRFATSDGHVSLAGLQPGEALANAEAARLLGIVPGETLTLTFADDRAAGVHIRAVVNDAGLAGVNAAVIAPLAAVQAMVGRPDQINQILVANAGEVGDAARSREVTGKLRLTLADPELMGRIARTLSTEVGQSQLAALESRARPDARPRIAALREAAKTGRATPELAHELADPRLISQYRWMAGSLAGDPSLRGADLVERLAPLTVIDVKQRAITAANEYGSAITTVFLILGLFSIAASLLLVFLIFVMLAAERRTEMGLIRAIGVQRRHLIAAFAVEGLVYDLAAAAAGLVLGVGLGALVLRLIQNVLNRFDVTVHGRMSGEAIILSFSIGALVTFATVMLAAWRVSRVNIVAAVHGLPEPDLPNRPRVHGGLLLGVATVLLCAVLGVILVLIAPGPGARLAGGAALLVMAVAMVLRRVLLWIGAGPAIVDRLIATAAGPLIAVFFALSPEAPRWVRSDDVIRSATAGFVLAGVVMALSLVWAAGRNLDLLLLPVRVLARPFGALAPATRMAVAYPLTHPFRTGLTAAMFALVFLTMVAASTLLHSTETAYVDEDGGAGFDVRAQFTTPPDDFRLGLAASGAVRPEDFTAIGALALNQAEALWTAERAAAWRPVELRVADTELLETSRGELLARAHGYASDEAVWRALQTHPGLAIASRNELESLPAVQTALNAGGGQIRFDPATVWVRDPRGGPAKKLTVIGVTADGTIVPAGLIAFGAAVEGTPFEVQPPNEFFLRVREDVSYRSAATGIPLTFPENGVRARVLGDAARTGQAVRGLLDTLVRGFLGMGLAAGIAALGVVGMRSVAERRQQIGMLRALGFSRRMVQASFLLEGSVVAILGITIGGIVGLVLARNVVIFLGRDFRDLQLVIPWLQIGGIALAAYGAALISGMTVAWQAGRISPAEALRYE
jgi:putative ABC transport system permease protein